MSTPEFDWKLKGGYSELVRGGEIEARLDGRTARLMAGLAPGGAVRRTGPVDLSFVLRRPWRAEFPGQGVLRLDPQVSLKARILFSHNTFLGNFRVPERHFAIQWTVQGAVEKGGQQCGVWKESKPERG